MREDVTSLIERLKTDVPFLEVRTAPASGEYFEGVLLRKDLPRCCEVLCAVLGQATKEFGQPAKLAPPIQQTVNGIGGIRPEQCLFLTPSGTTPMVYATLWPWASDATRITLKVGVLH